ncbi:glycosyltransferase family 39 protein [Aquirufa ecclesiirivi]|uniref:glycosyltransferase family 39 protein n=1 Tax=Aquirufa ecclesiirivi TaxID=2715124 RepID=UPI0014079BC0|nr:glycosyltransferase family 39 protein [Aquirufa ecclesiirivi]NHC48489.1 phospholipid carrier-dependent glycosyltransferase [Aquirufa ecclesiirivi]
MYWIAFISFILMNYKVASKISNKNLEEILIIGFTIYTSSIILTGYGLSALDLWNSRILWAIVPFFITSLIYYFFQRPVFAFEMEHISAFKVIGHAIQTTHQTYVKLTGVERFIFACLFWSFLVVCALQITLVFNSPPNEWDSMTGHLNRVIYFLKQGSMSHFIGTNWNIDTYPRSFCSLQVYPFLMSGYNEYLFKLPNIGSYWIISFGIYGILKNLGVKFKTRLFLSMLFLFLPNVLMQSITTETDIVLAAYLCSIVYYLVAYRKQEKTIYLYLAGLTFGLALSHKITFVFSFIPLLILYAYCFLPVIQKKAFFVFKHVIIAHLLGIVLFVAATGYISNFIHYGHPIGPPTATQHQSVERAGSLGNLFVQGSRNVVRYGFDLFNLDGLRNIMVVEKLNHMMKTPFRVIDQGLHLGLERVTEFTIIPFTFDKRFEFYNGSPIYGSIFIFIILPSILMFIRRPNWTQGLFLLAFAIHFATLAFTAAYDPWKGRYMISSAIYLFPLLGYMASYIFERKHTWSVNLIFGMVVVIISLSAIFTLGLNIRALPFTAYGKKSILELDRISALTINRPDITKAYQNFEKLVPNNAIVALGTINDDFEYPLWGEKFSRKLIPLNPFEQGIQAIPAKADYLFFSKQVFKPQQGDVRLGTDTTLVEGVLVRGEDYYLRKLH